MSALADFNQDRIPDVAVLGNDTVSIYLGERPGGLPAPSVHLSDAGLDPTGLTVADVNRDGKPDLLVGNPFGDVLVLAGPRRRHVPAVCSRPARSIALAVADLTGNGTKDIIYANQGLDRVVVDYGGGPEDRAGRPSKGLLAPGAVKLADLNGDGIPDLIVANSGGNNVLVYPGLGNGQFGPALNGGQGFFTGTNPVGVTVADLNGAARPGGRRQGFQRRHHPPQSSDGRRRLHVRAGPAAQPEDGHAARDRARGDGDRAVTGRRPVEPRWSANSGSNQVWLIPGVGGGFFNDQNPTIFPVGNQPRPALRRQLRRQARPGRRSMPGRTT